MVNTISENELKPCANEETQEKSMEESIAQKERLEILSNELVIAGKEVENVRPETEETVENDSNISTDIIKETDGATKNEITQDLQENQEQEVKAIMEDDISKIEETQDSLGNEEMEVKHTKEDDQKVEYNLQQTSEVEEENMEAEDIESRVVDVNMVSQLEMEITSKTDENTDDFSNQSSAILSDIENIQSSVDKEQSASLNVESVTKSSKPSSGLSLLAQYDSEDNDNTDTDSVIEVPATSAKDYRNQVVEINSDSDSDDTDSDSDVEYLNEIRKTIEKRMEVADEDDEDEEDDDNGEGMSKKKHKPKVKVKGEMLLEDLPPIQDLQITVPEDECIELGKIHSIVDQLVLVSVLPNAILLDLETVIFLEKGQKVLGEVFDVLGQVADPLYCVRFNSNKQIKEKEINVGDVVYVAPKTQYTQYVILSSLMKMKGSDASWENDIEPPPRFLDYSDDEQEQLAKRQLRNKDRPVDNDEPHKRLRTSEGGEQTENRPYTPNHRNRYAQQREDNNNRNRGDGSNYNNNSRPRYNNHNYNHRQQQQPQQQQPQQQPNYHRNSWHSNYYPQQYQQAPPSQNYGYNPNNRGHTQQNQSLPPPPQAYPTQVPMYAMPPMHAMPPYPPPTNYGPQGSAPHMAPQPLMPNSFTIRPPTLHGVPPQQQFTSPPPPPGAL